MSELIAGFGKLACSKQHLIVCQSDPPCPCHRVNLYRNPSAQANIAFKTTVDVWCEDDSVNKSHQNLKSDESSPLMAFIGVRIENSDNYAAASVHCLTEGHFKLGQSKVSHLLSDGEKNGRKSWKLENGLTFTDLAYDDRTDPSELKVGDEVNYYRFSAKDKLLESHYERKIHRKDCVAWVRKVVDKSADLDSFGENSNGDLKDEPSSQENGNDNETGKLKTRPKGKQNGNTETEAKSKEIKRKVSMPRVDIHGKAVYDILFVMDESPSIGPVDFEKEKEFLSIFIKKFGIIPGFSKTAAVKFSHNAIVEWDFGNFRTQDTDAVLEKINAMKCNGYSTNIDVGLKMAKSIMSKYRRRHVIQAVLLLTDGQDFAPVPRGTETTHYVGLTGLINGAEYVAQCNPEVDLSPSRFTAEQMRQSGIQVFVIGIGKEISPIQLNAIASGEVFRTDIQDLPSIADQVVKKIREHGKGIKQTKKSKSNAKK